MQAGPRPRPDARTESADSDDVAPRLRLIEGMAAALVEKPLAAVTIADIVRHARVSKRTFYEYFDDKEACFLACYRAMSELLLVTLESQATPHLPWREQVQTATEQYLAALEARPALTRALLTEIQAAGPRALNLRREMMQRFADTLRDLVERGRRQDPTLRSLSPAMAMAVVGGINELTLLEVERGRESRLTELAGTATELLHAVLRSTGE